MRILLLGGTGEARRLAARLAARADLSTVLSFAGRTDIPAEQPVPVRIGGFGGVEGLRAYLSSERIDAVVDATHPFAAGMSANAFSACRAARVPLARLVRPAWTPEPGDNWLRVAGFPEAVQALGPSPRRVFLTIGLGGLGAFARAPQHAYLIRSISEPEGALPPDATILRDRPPYDVGAETELMREARIDILVTKNSGGTATAAKLTAARHLGLPVVMIERPVLPPVPEHATGASMIDWIDARQAERGV